VLLQRDAELTALDRQVAQVRTGTGRLILVEGPAGIGKSSLLAAAARTAAVSGLRVLRAWGGPLEHDAGWGIARQLFATVRGGTEWEELATGAAGLARRALDADGAEPALAGDAMHAAAHGLIWLAYGLAERGPALFVVDDVHWADAPSLRWLIQLTRQLADLPLGLLCAVRAGEPPAEPGLLAELLAAAPEAPVRPSPLGPPAVQAVVRQRLPAAGHGFAHACHAVTAGNPFLLGALLDHLAAEQLDPTDEVGTRLSAYGPEQVARGVERQLSRLHAGAAALARAFAVLGRAAPLRHAGELADLAPAPASRLADQLRAAGLLDSDGDGYALVHPLVANALYSGVPPGARALLHERAARLLAAERADPEAVALHLLRSEPARDATTVAALCAAAERASLRGAPESAVAFLRRALAEPPPHQNSEAEVRSQLGRIRAAQVGPDAPVLLEQAVGLATTPDQRSRIALSGGRALAMAGYFGDSIRLCQRGLDHPSGAAPLVLTRLEAELVCTAWLHASGVAEAHERLHRSAGTLPVWRILQAMEAVYDARPVDQARELLAPVLDPGALDEEADSILTDALKLTLVPDPPPRVRLRPTWPARTRARRRQQCLHQFPLRVGQLARVPPPRRPRRRRSRGRCARRWGDRVQLHVEAPGLWVV
jgi:hypothetical protein